MKALCGSKEDQYDTFDILVDHMAFSPFTTSLKRSSVLRSVDLACIPDGSRARTHLNRVVLFCCLDEDLGPAINRRDTDSLSQLYVRADETGR